MLAETALQSQNLEYLYKTNPEGMLARQTLDALMNGSLAPRPDEVERFMYRRNSRPIRDREGLAYVEVSLIVPSTGEHIKISGMRGNDDTAFDDNITAAMWGRNSTETQALQNGDVMTLGRDGEFVLPFGNQLSDAGRVAYYDHASELRTRVGVALNGLIAS